jgi:CRP-like cAMP-binding protein
MAESAVDILSKVPIFARLSGRQLRKILRGVTEDHYDAGTVIVRQGSRGETMFVIVEGRAKVVRDERTIAHRGEGEFFGEISVIDGRPRTAAVIAETPIRCLVIFRDQLREALMDEPAAAWAMLESLASRLREE